MIPPFSLSDHVVSSGYLSVVISSLHFAKRSVHSLWTGTFIVDGGGIVGETAMTGGGNNVPQLRSIASGQL